MRGVIGYPLGHSYSKDIHEYLTNKPYHIIELDEEKFHDFMKEKNFSCINVTIPYKQMVIPYLDKIDDLALKLDAINCIVNKDGTLIGYNSDYYGFKLMLEANQVVIKDRVVAILGNGGASKAVYEVVKDMQAKTIYIVDRNNLSNTISYEEIYNKDLDVIINTTPVGMFPNNDGCIIDVKRFKNLEWVVDIVYNPIRTKLVIEALNFGIKAIGGLEMLVAQAVKALEFFDGIPVDSNRLKACYKKLLNDKQNIVLIGMPSGGKTTIANILGKKLQREVLEMDDLIVQKIGMPIRNYIEQFGEEAFRQQEIEMAKELRNHHHTIISCGGGIILKEESMNYLKENGCIVFIDRDLNKLLISDDRPLSNTQEKLNQLYQQRYDLYRKYSDIIIDNNGDLHDTVDRIIESVG